MTAVGSTTFPMADLVAASTTLFKSLVTASKGGIDDDEPLLLPKKTNYKDFVGN
jgi:hypothetical protein